MEDIDDLLDALEKGRDTGKVGDIHLQQFIQCVTISSNKIALDLTVTLLGLRQ